jgi:hypothetical protein
MKAQRFNSKDRNVFKYVFIEDDAIAEAMVMGQSVFMLTNNYLDFLIDKDYI